MRLKKKLLILTKITDKNILRNINKVIIITNWFLYIYIKEYDL